MPLYAYRCTSCGNKFEKIQNFSAEPETICPKCGEATLIRPLTAPRLNLKAPVGISTITPPKALTHPASYGDSKPAESKEAGKIRRQAGRLFLHASRPVHSCRRARSSSLCFFFLGAVGSVDLAVDLGGFVLCLRSAAMLGPQRIRGTAARRSLCAQRWTLTDLPGCPRASEVGTPTPRR